jgi:molybdenum cofactor guanylyltransferase
MTTSILCGGKSSRMETEKGLVLYQNKPFIEHVIDAVLPISNTIKLISNSADYDYLGFAIVNDLVLEKGPLGGIYSALVQSETENNLLLSCDIPLISTGILMELINKHTSDFEISVFKDEDKIHPLIGMYSKKLIPVLEKALDENKLKMMDFISNSNHQLIAIDKEKRKFFKNINSVAELNDLNNITV